MAAPVDLFDFADPCAARHGDAPTSLAAWDAAREHAESDRERILALVAAAGERGVTLDEVAARWDVAPNRISGRFSQLARRNLIRDSGRTRPTRTRRPAVVWVVR